MRYLVTGGAGFIGSHLVDELIHRGHSVVVLDNMDTGDTVNPQAVYIKADISKDDIDNCFQGIDGVFHQAAMGRVPMCVEDPVRAYKVNVLGTVKVFEAARKAGVKKVVQASSCIVYSDQEMPYKTTKVAAESIADCYTRFYNLPAVSLRYGNVYGLRQKIGMDSAMFAMLRDEYNKSGRVVIFGDGTQTRDWVHVKDVARANIMAMESQFTGWLDVCTGHAMTLNYIVSVLGVPAVYTDWRRGDARFLPVDPTKAQREIGFTSTIQFEDAIKEVWNA